MRVKTLENSELMALRTYRSKAKVTCVRTGKTKKISRYKTDVSEPGMKNSVKRPRVTGEQHGQPDDVVATTSDEQPLNITTLRSVPMLYSYFTG